MPSAWFCIALHIFYTHFNPSTLHSSLSFIPVIYIMLYPTDIHNIQSQWWIQSLIPSIWHHAFSMVSYCSQIFYTVLNTKHTNHAFGMILYCSPHTLDTL